MCLKRISWRVTLVIEVVPAFALYILKVYDEDITHLRSELMVTLHVFWVFACSLCSGVAEDGAGSDGPGSEGASLNMNSASPLATAFMSNGVLLCKRSRA